MAASGWKSTSASRLDISVAALLGAVLVALALGAAVPWAPLFAVLAVIGVVCVARFGLSTVLLHALVLSMFFEGLSVQDVRVGRVLAAAVPVVMYLRFTTTGWRPRPLSAWVCLPPLLFLTWSWASGLWAGDSGAWLSSMAALVLAAAYFLAFALLVDSRAQVRELLRTFVLGATVAAFVALAQAGVNVRSVGLQGDPNIFSLYQVAAVAAAAVLARTARVIWSRLAWLLAILPLIASVFAAQSRGGLLTLAVVAPLALIRGDFGRLRRFHTPLSVVATVVALAGLVTVARRIDNRLTIGRVLQDKGTGRLDIWRAAWAGYTQHPWTGLGAGGFEPQSSHLLETTPGVGLDPYSVIYRTGIRVHNIYLESLAELGPLGLLLWLAVLVGIGVALARIGALRASKDAASALVVMLIAFAVSTTFLSVTNSKLLWMIAGLAAAAESIRRADRRDHDPALRSRSVSAVPPGAPARPAVTLTSAAGLSSSSITYSAATGPGRRSTNGAAAEHGPPGSVES